MSPESSRGAILTNAYLLALALLTLGLAVFFLNSPGTSDVQNFLKWMEAIQDHGLVAGYAEQIGAASDRYPPLAFVLLSGAHLIGQVLDVGPFLGLKLLLLLFLLLTSAAFFLYTRDLLLTCLFQLALTLDSVALGYLDILTAPFLVLCFLALKRGRSSLAVFLFSIAFLIKFQPILIAPLIGLYILGVTRLPDFRRINWKRVGLALTAGITLPALLLIVFGSPFFTAFRNTGKVELLSGDALNLPWILTFLLHLFSPERYGPLYNGEMTLIQSPQGWSAAVPYLLFLLAYVAILIRFIFVQKTIENLLLYGMLATLAQFLLAADAHENHLFTPVVLAGLLAFENRERLPQFLFWALAANANLILFYGLEGQGFSFSVVIGGLDVTVLFAVVNVAVYAVMLWEAFRPTRRPAPALSPRS